jgi:hypothetical protein
MVVVKQEVMVPEAEAELGELEVMQELQEDLEDLGQIIVLQDHLL